MTAQESLDFVRIGLPLGSSGNPFRICAGLSGVLEYD